MNKKRIASLSKDSLFEMGDVLAGQHLQLDSLESERDEIGSGIEDLKKNNIENAQLLQEAESLIDTLVSDGVNFEFLDSDLESIADSPKISIRKTDTIRTHNNWDDYVDEYKKFAVSNSIDTDFDPFLISLGQGEYQKLKIETDDEFAKKTGIINKTDLSFLAIAIALQTAKALIFPLVSQKIGYGTPFDKETRLAHDDASIKKKERADKDKFRDKKIGEKNENGEWMEILYRKPIYDTTKGSPQIGINMEGGYHRIHTLGHDPVLGWLFGTANILTDTITFDNFATYQGVRDPIRITTEKVPFFVLAGNTIKKIKEEPLNLPAAIMAEKIHLESDKFTKAGLPVPILETINPAFAGKLYKGQYDALCFGRDLKVIGTSAVVSLLIDMVIGLVHSLYYDAGRDGTKELFEVRTRKILLLSNTIASSSNIIYSVITHNPRNLDIGGLLVTLSHLICDTSFIVNVKKEFIENRIYEKIEEEIKKNR